MLLKCRNLKSSKECENLTSIADEVKYYCLLFLFSFIKVCKIPNNTIQIKTWKLYDYVNVLSVDISRGVRAQSSAVAEEW